MLSDKDKKICEKYSARDKNGFVHCRDCPLVVNKAKCLCKARTLFPSKRKENV